MINYDIEISETDEVLEIDFSDATGFIDNYNQLTNRPTVNGTTIEGNMTPSDFGVIESYDGLTNKPSINGVTVEGDLTSSDLGIVTSYGDLSGKPSVNGTTIEGEMAPSDFGVVTSYDELSDRPTVNGNTITGAMYPSDFGVVTSYNGLSNKPSINGQTLAGNVTISQLGVVYTDTMAGWSAKRDYVGLKDVFYVYSDYQAIDNGNGTVTTYAGLKIGDGVTKLNQLPYLNSPDPRLLNHIANNSIHITSAERSTWNTAVSDVNTLKQQVLGGMHFVGSCVSALTDQATTKPITITSGSGTTSYTQKSGDVVIYGLKEYVWDGAKWIEFGDLSALSGVVYVNSGGKIDNTYLESNVVITNQNRKIDSSLLPAATYDSSTGTITF